jgi:O-acetyl-ADP-ribose deacetylase (regulator of RNase III)
MGTIQIIQGDITEQVVDVIVNAANVELVHGGGVAGAIVRAGGETIQEESNHLAPIPLGEAAVTHAGKLKCRYIIHAASMRLGGLANEASVWQAIASSFKRAEELGLRSIAFPAIGAGIAGFPMPRCAELSIAIAREHLDRFDRIIFVLSNPAALQIFQSAYERIIKPASS